MEVYGDAQAATLHGLGNQTTAGVHENVGTVTWRALIRVAVKVTHSAHGPESQWSVCIFPPQRSAKEFMAEAAAGVREEIDRKWVEASDHLPGIPYQSEQYGTTSKKGSMKRRRTTGKSPHKADEVVKQRRLSVNQNIDLERDFPECNLTKVSEIRETAEIYRAIWMHVVQLRIDANKDETLEKFLEPCAVLADLESYFRQFVMSVVDGLRNQGMFIKLSEDEISKFVTDWRLQFGGKPGPVVGTQVADIIIYIWKRKMDEFERLVMMDATLRQPHPTAVKMLPPELRACMEDRARVDPQNADSQRPSWCHQFVDDFTAICLGKLRALKAILLYLEVCEDVGLPVSLQKTEWGNLFTNLGLDFYLGRRGAYALLTKQCKNDLNAIHAEFIKNIGVPFADPEPLFLNPTSMLHYMWSDSSRSKNPKDFSGMGGFCALTGLAWYWEYDDAEREGMQIFWKEIRRRGFHCERIINLRTQCPVDLKMMFQTLITLTRDMNAAAVSVDE
jgi:hypothetical protein